MGLRVLRASLSSRAFVTSCSAYRRPRQTARAGRRRRSQTGEKRQNRSPYRGYALPQSGQSSPNRGNRSPQLGHASPYLGEAFPHIGECLPYLGERLPNIGERSPHIGECLPYVGECPPYLGERFPKIGECSFAVVDMTTNPPDAPNRPRGRPIRSIPLIRCHMPACSLTALARAVYVRDREQGTGYRGQGAYGELLATRKPESSYLKSGSFQSR
jgi:hypothetical protein